MPNAELSVAMAVHNGERFLRESIRSILCQTYDSFELIVVDDCSSDGTRNIISDLRDDRLVLLRNDRRQGQTHCLNQALTQSRGRYVARQDADDVSLPTRLEKQMAYLSKNPDIVLLGTWAETLTEHGDVVDALRPPIAHFDIVNDLVFHNPFFHSSVVFKRRMAVELGGYPVRFEYAQDWALWLMLSRKGKIAILPELLVKLRTHSQQLSRVPQLDHTRREEALRLIEHALTHPEVSRDARNQGRRQLAHLWLHYARLLADEGQLRRAWRYLIGYAIRFPDMLLFDRETCRKFAGTCAGPGIRTTARSLVHRRE